MRAWFQVYSQLRLELSLALPRLLARMLARRTVAPHMEQLDKPGEVTPVALAGEHRRPAVLVIFGTHVAAAIARVESVDPRGRTEAPKRPAEQQIGGAESVVDPAPAPVREAHARTALERLNLELGARAEIGDKPGIVEPGRPAPLEVGVDRLRIGAIVVTEELDPDRDRGLPDELGIIARPVGEPWADVEQGMGERRLVSGKVAVERRQRLGAEGQRRAVLQRPTAESEQGPGGVAGRHQRGRETPFVRPETRPE